MEMTLLGTGCPVVSTDRYGPATLVQQGDVTALIDCGSGVTQRLLEAGVTGADIDILLLTHLHSDHLVDLYQFVISSWHQGRQKPQRIIGPRGTRKYVDGLMDLWRREREQRIAHEMRQSTKAFDIEVEEIEDGWTKTIGDLEISAIEVEHQPVPIAFGFVFQANGRKLVVSGDTRPCDAIRDAALDADLLVHEVFIHAPRRTGQDTRTPEGIQSVASYHTLDDEVGKLAHDAHVGALVLTHIVPPHADSEALFKKVRADFKGPLIVGEDLMRFDIDRLQVRYQRLVLGFDAIGRE